MWDSIIPHNKKRTKCYGMNDWQKPKHDCHIRESLVGNKLAGTLVPVPSKMLPQIAFCNMPPISIEINAFN